MSFQRRPSTWPAALLLCACGTEAAPKKDAPTATARAVATASATTSAATDAKDLKAAKPKAHAATADDELGTLPGGVGIAVGETAPDFELPAVEGGKVSLSELRKKSEVLLVFYRGGW